jgi:YHYH protein
MKTKPLLVVLFLVLSGVVCYAQDPFKPPPPPFGPDGFPPPPPQRQRAAGPGMPQPQPAAQQPDAKVLSSLSPEEKQRGFSSNVKVSLTDSHLVVASDGIPNHPHADFPTNYNPNRILKQDYHFKIPLKPKFADKPAPLPFGPIGVAVNGIPFYNPYNAQGRDAVMGPNAEIFDSCCGHPDQRGRYHYHKYPVCIRSPFRDEPGRHSPLIGWAFDGFAIYGPNGEDGQPAKELDECNGHTDAARGYHYHVTAKFPYVLGAYKGVPEMSNFPGPRVWGGEKKPSP